ncbi:nuclear pore complex protein Nup93-like [Tachypleus tridentatus]|uniref:nuclear pore complex protein Nup93-like n=1 Tax=Tachypleus tridentatus TaxID=6853 RepID=UPI003FD49475
METDSTGLGELLEQAEQLTADIDGDGELPRVERNFRQILEAGQQLWTRTAQTSSRDTSDVKASILLASKGYDLPRMSQKLESLSTGKTFEPIEPIRETDIQGFLRNERENAILSVIEESKKATFERADRLYWESLENEWEQEKQRILNALVGSSQEVIDVTLNAESTVMESSSIVSRSAMDSIEMAYAKVIYQYNEQVVRGGFKYSLAEKFCELSRDLDDKNVLDLWTMVEQMINVPLTTGKDILEARSSVVMQTSLISQARKYLEQKYLQYIQAIVYGNLQQAQLGGIPGTYSLVRSFLNIRIPTNTQGLEDGLVEGHPVWPVIYYCIRCGDLNAALRAVKTTSSTLGVLVSYLTEYSQSNESRLSPSSEGQIRLQYRRSVRTSTDPYKRAVYCILGCCDVTDDHSEVATKTDDYLWLRLCQLRPEEEEEDTVALQQDRMTLSCFQTMLLEEYGESHFNAYQQPYLFFQVLFLSGQFEAAIEFLSRMEHLRCHAVHVAITLYEQNLLALPTNLNAPLLSKNPGDKPPARRLNFAHLIMIYTHKFEATDPREAIQYFYLLRNLKGLKGEDLFMACVSELVLETKEFEMLLGKMERDNCRKPGLIDKFQGDVQKIVEVVAVDSENKGLYEDAVKLYDLAKKHEKVLEMLNKLLSQVVPQVKIPGSTRDRLESMALDIAERYKTHGHSGSRETTGTCYLLLDLMTFFNQYHAKRYSEALDTIQKLKLLPFQTEDVEQKARAFLHYPEEVRRNLPDVLLATMNILYSEYKSRKSAGLGSPQTSFLSKQKTSPEEPGKYITHLRKQARALITFAGMIPYRMPGDTNARLVQMEVLMN